MSFNETTIKNIAKLARLHFPADQPRQEVHYRGNLPRGRVPRPRPHRALD